MSGELFALGEGSTDPGPVRAALDGWLAEGGDGVAGPAAAHAQIVADALDGQAAYTRAAAAGGWPVPPGVLMAQAQLSREWRDTWAALRASGGGDHDPAAELLATLAAPLVGNPPRP